MGTLQFKYNSVHDYLESVLSTISNPTHLQIKEAKREYWKQYYTHYRQGKRQIRKEFTLGFEKHLLQVIHRKKGTLSVSKFLYQLIDKALASSESTFYNTELVAELHLKLMQLISLIEELLDNENTEINEDVIERLDILEHTFSQLINS